MAHVEGVLQHAHAPHVLAVVGAGQREGRRLRLALALDAERALVVDHVRDVRPPVERPLVTGTPIGIARPSAYLNFPDLSKPSTETKIIREYV